MTIYVSVKTINIINAQTYQSDYFSLFRAIAVPFKAVQTHNSPLGHRSQSAE